MQSETRPIMLGSIEGLLASIDRYALRHPEDSDLVEHMRLLVQDWARINESAKQNT
jgi:hypothetical protein